MWRCRIVDVLFRILPVKVWQDWLIRLHLLSCPRCREKLADVKEVRAVLILEDDIGDNHDFWPAFRDRFKTAAAPQQPRRVLPLRWALAAAGILAFFSASLLMFFPLSETREAAGRKDQVRIRYVRIEDLPADTYVFQSKESQRVFVWAEKKASGG